VKQTAVELTRRQRVILAGTLALIHLTLPARILGDFLIYRTGIAGKLPRIAWFERLGRVSWAAGLVGSALLLPAVWGLGALALSRWQVRFPAAVVLSGLLTVVCGWLIQRFNRQWTWVDSYRVGTAKALTGRCAVFQVFLGAHWRREERQRCRRAVRAACDWLEGQARAHDVSLHLLTDPAELYLLEDACISPTKLTWPDRWRAYRVELDGTHQLLKQLRPQLAAAICERARRMESPPDQICLIAHLPVRGIGFAMTARNDLHLDSELELCACGRKSSAAVYAHELLHLFGAPDLYLNPWWVLTRDGDIDARTGSVERRIVSCGMRRLHALFGSSIMNTTALSLERLQVDPITARAIGWRSPDGPYMRSVQEYERAFRETVLDVFERPWV
jgi:hypothetical protein